MWVRTIPIFIGLVSFAGGYLLLAGWAHRHTCFELLPVRDSAELEAREATELMQRVKETYASFHGPLFPLYSATTTLARPVVVLSISGKTATLWFAGPSDASNFLYPEDWSRVWGWNHGQPPPYKENADMPCVTMNEKWNGGGFTTQDLPVIY